jgi:hypothetical protein
LADRSAALVVEASHRRPLTGRPSDVSDQPEKIAVSDRSQSSRESTRPYRRSCAPRHLGAWYTLIRCALDGRLRLLRTQATVHVGRSLMANTSAQPVAGSRSGNPCPNTPKAYIGRMRQLFAGRVLVLVHAVGFTLGLGSASAAALEAQAGAHTAHRAAHATDAPSDEVAAHSYSTPGSVSASAIGAQVCGSTNPGCCSDCRAPECQMTTPCGGTHVAAAPIPDYARPMAVRRSDPETRAEPARSLVHAPPTPPPQLVG